MRVTFGQNKLVALAQIQNKKTEKFESALIYEIDCEDEFDYTRARNDSTGWHFTEEFPNNILCKFLGLAKFNRQDPCSFYILKNDDNETIGRVQIDKQDRGLYTVEWLDTKENNGYRFVGQTLLASAAKEALEKGGTALLVPSPMEDAEGFYKDVCEFQDCGKSGFYMDEKQMKSFISRTEKRTKCPIIDLKV